MSEQNKARNSKQLAEQIAALYGVGPSEWQLADAIERIDLFFYERCQAALEAKEARGE